MTSAQAGALVKRGRTLLRSGIITHHQFTLLDCMVWSCRAPGSDRMSVSYSRLQRLARMARDTVGRGLKRLEALGLFRKIKRRVRVYWGGAVASRQATNIYVLDTESGQRPVCKELKDITLMPAAVSTRKTALDAALRSLGETLRASLPGR